MRTARNTNWWSYIEDMSMERKLFLVFLVIITLPLSFISVISFRSYSESIQANTIAYSEKLIDQMMDSIDDYIEDMKRISSMPAYVNEIKQNLIRSNRYYEQKQMMEGKQDTAQVAPGDLDLLLSIQRGIEENISFINNIKRGTNSVYIFDAYGNGYYSAKDGGIRLDLQQSYRFWSEQVKGSGGEATLLGTQAYTSNLQSTRYAFTVVRPILDGLWKPAGLIAVEANFSNLENQVAELDKVTRGKSILVDQSGKVIYDSEQKLLTVDISRSSLFRAAEGSSGSFYDTVSGKDRLNIYSSSTKTNWKVIISIPVDELTRGVKLTRNATIGATLIIIVLALIISIILSFALTKPLTQMIQLMKKVQGGDLDVTFRIKRRDEIGLLGHQFNRMLARIRQLIQDIYQIEEQKKEAELQALQSQINPHFIYNTLETIRMTAEINDDVEAADMISILGKLLRYSTSDLTGWATMKQELLYVRNYVELLGSRYPGRFELKIDVPEALDNYSMIKLVFQPIIENAAYHGLDDTKSRMHLSIKCEYTEQRLLFHIRDDGCGMDQVTLDKLRERLRLAAPPKKSINGGIGMANVHQRLQLHYGPAYGIEVFSKPGAGTDVILSLPLPGRAAENGREDPFKEE
ncbi:sensor histidine kinase [Paenibacillus sp. FSL P4-0338]|uniref:cache domain-containing sensor histidine kinase n=1 Tax=unclassified Paenibacillus TaxID=185978 RepID=UPI0003E24DE2|nr:sensor histidine kinase [Paenibacillus sp. FSL R7-269]ETT46624.1 integral membrane sensor signal transduction histidine kinase [Paenibacillus sp. FSL R7-269]